MYALTSEVLYQLSYVGEKPCKGAFFLMHLFSA